MTTDPSHDGRLPAGGAGFAGLSDYIEKFGRGHGLALVILGNGKKNIFIQSGGVGRGLQGWGTCAWGTWAWANTGVRKVCRRRHHDDVCAERAKFRSEAAFGIHLQVQKSGGHRRASTQGKENYEQAAIVGSEQAANNVPKHGGAPGHVIRLAEWAQAD